MSNTKHTERITSAAQVPTAVTAWAKASKVKLAKREYGEREDHDCVYPAGTYVDFSTDEAGQVAYEILVETGATKKEAAFALGFQLPKDLTRAANRHAAKAGLSAHKRQGGGARSPKPVTFTQDEVLALLAAAGASKKALAKAEGLLSPAESSAA